MDPGLIAGLVLVGVTALTVFAAIIVTLSLRKVGLRPLSGAGIPPNVMYASRAGGPVDEDRLRLCFARAVALLEQGGPWRQELVMLHLAGTTLNINDLDAWTRPDGLHVAGETLPMAKVTAVGPKFEALCHELAHILEYHVDRRVDFAHAGWSGNGLHAVMDRYASWLKGV